MSANTDPFRSELPLEGQCEPEQLYVNPASVEATALAETIERKQAVTQRWVRAHCGPGWHALFLGPGVLAASAEAQSFAGHAMAQVLAEVYPPDGQGYPLPEFIAAESNTAAMAAGVLKPYLALIAPETLTTEMVAANPSLLVHRRAELTPIAVSARVVGEDGSQELGRSAKRLDSPPGFSGGVLVLQTYLDWLTNQGASSVARAEVRAGKGFGDPGSYRFVDSGPTQALYYRDIGLRPTRFLPGYVVGGALEPFVIAEMHRDDSWRTHLHQFPIYTPPGEHTAVLEAFCRYQTGEALPVAPYVPDAEAYDLCTEPIVHGDTVYAKVDVLSDSPSNAGRSLAEALARLDTLAPTTLVRVPAHTPQGAVTQALLARQGFIVCGFEPAHDALDGNSGQPTVAPPMVCMARLGQSVRSGAVRLDGAYIPDGVYPAELWQAFERVDTAFEQSIMVPYGNPRHTRTPHHHFLPQLDL